MDQVMATLFGVVFLAGAIWLGFKWVRALQGMAAPVETVSSTPDTVRGGRILWLVFVAAATLLFDLIVCAASPIFGVLLLPVLVFVVYPLWVSDRKDRWREQDEEQRQLREFRREVEQMTDRDLLHAYGVGRLGEYSYCLETQRRKERRA